METKGSEQTINMQIATKPARFDLKSDAHITKIIISISGLTKRGNIL